MIANIKYTNLLVLQAWLDGQQNSKGMQGLMITNVLWAYLKGDDRVMQENMDKKLSIKEQGR